MKKITEQKLQAFQIGTMGQRQLSKREQEERRKKEEEIAAASVFKEFVETFEGGSSSSKVWVKAGTYDAGSRKEDNREKGKLYKPQCKLEDKVSSSTEKAQEYAKSLTIPLKIEPVIKKNKVPEKKKSNLELFKEELRKNQKEREERHKYKSSAKSLLAMPEIDPVMSREMDMSVSGSMDTGDPNTTNIYLGNLNPKITEQELMELFGRYGPLASIKIMWPRSEEEKSRNRNCGFVAYMSRVDADRALRSLNGRDVMGYEMKLGWGKSVVSLNHPIYVPPALIEHTLPPPASGLPFNAQPQPSAATDFPPKEYFLNINDPDVRRDMEELAYNSIVKVMIPTERPLLAIIHRMIEFVIREGPLFEAMIMSREIDNPNFRFLFENDTPSHTYYRWKLFSLLQGDTPTEWRQKEFRMFKGGPIWKPPPENFYSQGMPEELIVDPDALENNRGQLSKAQRDRLEDLVRHLTPERSKIGDCMIFCIEHADAADEICECIEQSLDNPKTLISKKVARLYLVSDILHNCTVKVSNASFFRTSMERYLEEMFRHLHATYKGMDSRLKAEGFKVRVMQVCKAWDEWAVYSREFLQRLKNVFLGLSTDIVKPEEPEPANSADEKDDEDLDGVPLDGAALLKSALMRGIPSNNSNSPLLEKSSHIHDNGSESEYDDDIDGIPLDEDIDGIPLDKAGNINLAGGFIPSKWETVDPDQIEAQAITTSKWDTLDPVAPDPPAISNASDDSFDSFENLENNRDFDEMKRLRLRQIEIKTVQYQDELESGQRAIKPGCTIQQQTEHYRRKLLRKSDKEMLESPSVSSRREMKRSPSPIPHEPIKKSKKSKRSRSRSISPYSRSTRRSPIHSKKSLRDSPSPSRSVRSSKRMRSRSHSRSYSSSPKRYVKDRHSPSPIRLSKYESPPRRHRSPSPPRSTQRSGRSARDPSPSSARYSSVTNSTSTSSRHRSEKHRHKHKYQ